MTRQNPGRLQLMCNKCTYVYSAPQQAGFDIGVEDPVCRNARNPGTLIEAPEDSVPGTYYDDSKNPHIECVTVMARYGIPRAPKVNRA